jgi:hypothetical protein
VAGGVVLAAVVAWVGALALRPVATVSVGDVAVECVGIGSTDACEAWATARLADGPDIRTFDPADLERIRLVRPFLLPGDCTVEYFVGRDLDEAVAREVVACPGG